MSGAKRIALALAAVGAAAAAMLSASAVVHAAPSQAGSGDDTPVLLKPKGEVAEEVHGGDERDAGVEKLRDAYYWSNLLAGDNGGISVQRAARLRSRADRRSSAIRVARAAGLSRGGTWVNQGPNPLVEVGRTTNTFEAVSGRVSALAIRKNGTIILGAAQGGIWTYNSDRGTSGTWLSRSTGAASEAVGALALAPSNDRIVYMGSGEGSLSGDSYFGDGVYRSDNGGKTWKHVSALFTGQSVTAMTVDPHHPNVVYAATAQGISGLHDMKFDPKQKYGVWRSVDSGAHWTLLKGTNNRLHGATSLVMDPQHPRVLWAAFWGNAIYRTTDAGKTWTKVMGDLPKGRYNEAGTRFALGLSHPKGYRHATVYTGFDYTGLNNKYHPAQVWKTTDNGAHWALATGSSTGIDSVVDYCSTQCFYDNEVVPDPTNPKVVYVLGCYGYNNSPPSGGIYRSTDGGATWKNLGYDLHPDYHAIAIQANRTSHIAIGNDGGVWQSFRSGGRLGPHARLHRASWQDLNGQVDPSSGTLEHSTGLAISQFQSLRTVPQVAGQFWGGTQDNGTLRKSTVNDRWFDQAGGDGGVVNLDQSTVNSNAPSSYPAYVFGEYYGISPFRYGPTEVNTIYGNEYIDGGLDQSDRAEFYVPVTQNQGNPDQLFLGTYRVYRTDNAETPNAGDVHWSPISGDLTSGCTGRAPNGARGCLLSAIGLSDGGTGVYAGTDEGWIQVAPHGTDAAHPAWHRVGAKTLPARPVNEIAVDRSNWRIAYAAFSGFSAATPKQPGHVYATKDGGKHWANVSSNLPDVPVNTIAIDPSDSSVLYAGTDIGPMVTTDGGRSWSRLGSRIPRVAVFQLSYDAAHGVLAAGTHGRGAWTLNNRSPLPALVVSKADSGAPVGPGSTINYTITLKNIGNAAATGVTVTDPLPAHTVSANIGNGGHFTPTTARWDDVTVKPGRSVQLTFSVRIVNKLPSEVKKILDDGLTVHSAQGVSTTGSPHVTPIAHPYAVSVAPTHDTEGAKDGQQASFTETITNDGYKSDSYHLATSGGSWTSTVYAADCSTPLTTTDPVAPGDSTDVCVKTDVPADAPDNQTDTATLTATSAGAPAVRATASLTSIAVAIDVLVVDEDTNDPVDSAPYYENALTSDEISYSYWDLSKKPDLPQSYLTAHSKVVWFTGTSYPAPLGPYEPKLKAFLDNGGSLFMSGQDILDQAAGTTPFVHDYLHIDWDGTETQNDKATNAVHSVTGNPVTDGLGTVPLDHSVLNAAFEDEITPIDGAQAAFTDDATQDDALSFAGSGYHVVFLAFPFEEYGTAQQRATLMGRAFTFFGP